MWKKFYKESKNRQGQGVHFLEYLEVQIWKIYLLGANHGGTLVDLMYVPVCPKNSGYITGTVSWLALRSQGLKNEDKCFKLSTNEVL